MARIDKGTRAIIEKWYKRLSFNTMYDEEFYSLLNGEYVTRVDYKISEYDMSEADGTKNLLSSLYMCEELSLIYNEKGICDEVLIDTLSDIPVATDSWYDLCGELTLGSMRWLSNHFNMKLFKLGRLQFGFGNAAYTIEDLGLKKGDSIIEVHIQGGGPLLLADCLSSFEYAIKFFDEYYKDYSYNFFTCYSWLLDKGLKDFLPEDSNILSFAGLFNIYETNKSDRLLNYIFKRGAAREDIADAKPKSAFAAKIKDAILSGHDFYEAFGVIDKSFFTV